MTDSGSVVAGRCGPRDGGAERPRVGVIGAGRAGMALAIALAGAGYPICVAHGRSATTRERIRTYLPVASCGTPDEVVRASDVVFLTVSDDAIARVAEDLAAAGAIRPGHVLAHVSGCHGLGVLDPAVPVGALRMAVHPIMTLSGAEGDAGRLVGASFGVTADPDAEPVAAALVAAVGGQVVPVPDQARTAYHAAIVLAANYLGTLVTTATGLLDALGVPGPAHALEPLLRQSLQNVLDRGAVALTGPVRRGDAGTVRAHLDALAELDPTAASAYAALAALTVDQLRRAGLAADEPARALRAVLGAAAG